jgi:NodT family efflux transporter outer membrane factor (OMF) lipoprotein
MREREQNRDRGLAVRPALIGIAVLYALWMLFARPAVASAQHVQASGDPVLDELIATALETNPGVRAVEARIEGARAARFETTLDLAPRVTAVGGYTRQRASGAIFPDFGDGRLPDQDVWEVGTQLRWELDAFGRVRRSLSGRSALVGAAEGDVGAVRVRLAAEVATAYYRYRGDEDRLAVARRNAENQQRTLDLTLERLEAGRGTALDTERARAQLSTTLASVPALQASLAALRHRIAVLLGRDPGAPIEELAAGAAAAELLELPEKLAVPDGASLVMERPDVRSAARRRAAGEAFVGSAKAEYLPRFSLQGGAGYTAEAFDAIGDSGTFRYGVGAVVEWPLFDLGRVKARVDAAQAEEAEVRELYTNTVLEAREEVETSIVAYNMARERLRHLVDAADASERATELARLRFESGATDFLEVLDSERRLLEAQDGLSAGRTDAAAALVAVFRALGGVWPDGAAANADG